MRKPIVAALFAATVTLLFSGCSSVQSRKAEYKSASTLPSLEVPPELTAPELQDNMELPAGAASGASSVLPAVSNIETRRDGTMHWLVVQASPDALWPKLRNFWQKQGLELGRDEPTIGIMETRWAENKADVPQDLISKYLPGLHHAPTRDKFRLRIERGTTPGTTEVYLTHYGLEEVQRGQTFMTADTIWQDRPQDLGLTDEMLNRLMVFLGVPQKVADQKEAAAKQPESRADLSKDMTGNLTIIMNETFDRAWRRVGIALDRVGLVVDDRDRSKGIYYVRTVDMVEDAGEASKGFFSGMFSGSGHKGGKVPPLRIVVQSHDNVVTVALQDGEGHADNTDRAKELLNKITAELR